MNRQLTDAQQTALTTLEADVRGIPVTDAQALVERLPLAARLGQRAIARPAGGERGGEGRPLPGETAAG